MTAVPSQHVRWAREYETIYLLNANAAPAESEKLAERLSDTVKRLGGKLTKLDNWGRRRLAYPIRKQSRANFVYFTYVGFNDLVAELERTLRITDGVMRFQTVCVRKLVDPAEVAVDPEEIKYRHVEVTEDEAEPDLAERLGMVQRPGGPPRSYDFDAAAEIPDEEIPDLNNEPDESTERGR